LEPKNLNNTHKRVGEGFTNALTSSYNTIAIVHSKFSSLVSSKTVYYLRYSPKARCNKSSRRAKKWLIPRFLEATRAEANFWRVSLIQAENGNAV